MKRHQYGKTHKTTKPRWFIDEVSDEKGLRNQSQPVNQSQEVKFYMKGEKQDLIRALQLFWNNPRGIEILASPLMVMCIKAGKLGSADLLLEYLEKEKTDHGSLPCERADLMFAADTFNQGVETKLIAKFLKWVDALIAWDHDAQQERGMYALLGWACNFYGKARELLGILRKPSDEQNRSSTTKLGIEPKTFTPAEFPGVVEKGLWEVLGLSQIDSEEHQHIGISAFDYDGDGNIVNHATDEKMEDHDDPKGLMTFGVVIEAQVVLIGPKQFAVLKVDQVDDGEFKRLIRPQKEGRITLRMDAIENRIGYSVGLKTLKAILHGNEPNEHSKLYHLEKFHYLRQMYCPKFSPPKNEGEHHFSPSACDYPYKNVDAGWHHPESKAWHEMIDREESLMEILCSGTTSTLNRWELLLQHVKDKLILYMDHLELVKPLH